jgi:hypothetical protein
MPRPLWITIASSDNTLKDRRLLMIQTDVLQCRVNKSTVRKPHAHNFIVGKAERNKGASRSLFAGLYGWTAKHPR